VRARSWGSFVAAAALFGVVTLAITWPLPPSGHAGARLAVALRLGLELVQRDINLTMWVLAWDSHALVTDPLHLFHANPFYPARLTLALEHMLGNAPVFTPVYLATGNPVLAHQVSPSRRS
jgi:hypothetical protein